MSNVIFRWIIVHCPFSPPALLFCADDEDDDDNCRSDRSTIVVVVILVVATDSTSFRFFCVYDIIVIACYFFFFPSSSFFFLFFVAVTALPRYHRSLSCLFFNYIMYPVVCCFSIIMVQEKNEYDLPSINVLSTSKRLPQKTCYFFACIFDYYYFYILFPYLCVTRKEIYLVFFPSSSCFVITCLIIFLFLFFFFVPSYFCFYRWLRHLSHRKSSIVDLYNKRETRK